MLDYTLGNNLDNLINENMDYKLICDYLHDGIYVTDGQGTTIYVNDSYVNNLGVEKKDIIGKTISELEGTLYEGAVSLKVIEQRKRVDSIGRLFNKNVPVLVTGVPIFDIKGNVKMVVVSNRNITELNELKAKLVNLQASYEKNQKNLAYLINQDIKQKQVIYKSNCIKTIMDTIELVAKTDVTILISGETGTGKELFANAVYEQSNRTKNPFIKINCATIPQHLLESELFGYEPGTFTGALTKGKTGIFELANNGTLLLDEIGEIPLDMQAKLLRVLQEKEIRKIGGNKPIPVDVRLIAATNKNLLDEVNNGNFREDLYYRLNVVPLYIPPLRSRPEDIAPFVNHFLSIYNKKYGKYLEANNTFFEALKTYSWPGNVRELENFIERLVVTSKSKTLDMDIVNLLINIENFVDYSKENQLINVNYHEAFINFEKELFINTLMNNTSLRKSAAVLGISPGSLSTKCKKYNIDLKKTIGKSL